MFLLTFKTVAAIKFIIPCMAHSVLLLANTAPNGQRGRTDLSLMALFTCLLCFSGSVPCMGLSFLVSPILRQLVLSRRT